MWKQILVRKFLEYESKMLGEHIQISDDLKRKYDAVKKARMRMEMYGDDEAYFRALEDYLEAVDRFNEYDKRF